MKHIIILGDGMADWSIPSLGNKTPLEFANTPYMDRLASEGRTGKLTTVAPGFHPGSEVANMSIMGYNLPLVYEGRGPLEAASIGYELQPNELALRCNIISIDGENIKNHSSGHITTAEADILIKYLQENLGDERVSFHTGVQYRHLLVIKGGNKNIKCTPPHDVPGKPFRPLLAKALCAEAEETADIINNLILRSQELLSQHHLNIQRVQEGNDPANSIWPWGGGYRPKMAQMCDTYPQIKRGSVISAVDLIKGIGHYAGLRVIDVEGATGLYNTNYENKVAAAINALKEGDDFVYIHIEASDEAGHEGNIDLKISTIENLDKRVVGPIYEEVSKWDEQVAIAILPDHPTPCVHRTHTNEPIPFLIWYPGIEPDSVVGFSENSATNGAYGLLKEDQFIKEFLKH